MPACTPSPAEHDRRCHPVCVQCLSFDGGDKVFGQPDAASMRFKLDCVHLFRQVPSSKIGSRTPPLPTNPESVCCCLFRPRCSLCTRVLVCHLSRDCPLSSLFDCPICCLPRLGLCVCSLMHGVALQFLRSDWMLANLAEHDESKLPPWVTLEF